MKEEIKNHWQLWIFCLTIGIVLIVVYKALDSMGYLVDFFKNFFAILTPFLTGLLLAYLLYIPERKIEKAFKKSKVYFFRKKARKCGILTTYIIAILIIFIIVNVILPVLVNSVNELIGNIGTYYTKIIDFYNKMPEDSFFKTEKVYAALKELQNTDLQQYLSFERITGYVKSAVGFARGFFDIFIIIVVSVYFLNERNEILNFAKKLFKALFKEKTCNYISKYFYKSNGVFFRFISSQFVDAVLVGVLTTIAMKIMGIKYASLLGFSIGLFNMIPYFRCNFCNWNFCTYYTCYSRIFKNCYYVNSNYYITTNRCQYN